MKRDGVSTLHIQEWQLYGLRRLLSDIFAVVHGLIVIVIVIVIMIVINQRRGFPRKTAVLSHFTSRVLAPVHTHTP
jgi:hypothetical protein